MNPIRDSHDGLLHMADLIREKREEGMDPEPEPPVRLDNIRTALTNPPPTQFIGEATRIATDAFAQLPPGTNGAIVGILHKREGQPVAGNLAIVQRFGEHVKVVGWVGKEWGKPLSAGGAGVVTW